MPCCVVLPSLYWARRFLLFPRRDGLKGRRKWCKLRKPDSSNLYKWEGLLAAVWYLSVYMWRTSCRHEILEEEEYSAKERIVGVFLYFVIWKTQSSNRYTKSLYFRKVYVSDSHPRWAWDAREEGHSATTQAPDIVSRSYWADKEERLNPALPTL